MFFTLHSLLYVRQSLCVLKYLLTYLLGLEFSHVCVG